MSAGDFDLLEQYSSPSRIFADLGRKFTGELGVWEGKPNEPKIIDLIAPEGWPLNRIGDYERSLNEREQHLHQSRARTYRVYPFGTILPGQQAAAVDANFKAVIICQYCGQWGARGCACRHCGAPIA